MTADAASADAFYSRAGEWFVPTEATTWPWDLRAQHAGPPAALLGRAIERCGAPDGLQVGRITIEVLRPVPLAPVRPTATVVRSGRRVEYVTASLEAAGEEVMRAHAWRLRVTEIPAADLPEAARQGRAPVPAPRELPGAVFPPWAPAGGYLAAMEWRFASGSFEELAPATAWLRMRHPLLADEPTSPLTRVLVAADSGSGISRVLDFFRYLFINTDLTLHLQRPLAGEWVCLESRTTIQTGGVSLTETCVHDTGGRMGAAVQTLYVGPRQ